MSEQFPAISNYKAHAGGLLKMPYTYGWLWIWALFSKDCCEGWVWGSHCNWVASGCLLASCMNVRT